ncbi:MAG: hypothetical protein J5812_02525 [Candidatus Methanomethylophilaceae archaeon]|nr:hypothetical protein [Candidatus Methanomethylophilaceae archaeon]
MDYLIRALSSDYETRMVAGVPTFMASVVLTLLISLVAGLLISRNNLKIDMVVALKDLGDVLAMPWKPFLRQECPRLVDLPLPPS